MSERIFEWVRGKNRYFGKFCAMTSKTVSLARLPLTGEEHPRKNKQKLPSVNAQKYDDAQVHESQARMA